MLCHIPEIFNETTTNKFTNYIEYAANVCVCAILKRAFERQLITAWKCRK